MFSEASRRTIKELGNIELFELGEISHTTCLRYSKGTNFCKRCKKEDAEEENTPLLCSDGLLTHNTENPNGIMDGQKSIADTWTIRQLLM